MSIFDDAVEFVTSIPGAIVGVVEDPIGAFEDLFEAAGDAVSSVVRVLTESPECIILAGSPAYWQLVRELTAAKIAGVISNQENCEASRQKVAEFFPAINLIPGIEYFWGCACRMAISDAAVPASIATTAATATSQLALSAEDQITGVVSAVSWGPNRLDLFARGDDNAVWHGRGTKNWGGLGGQIQQPPAAVSWGSGRLDIFVCGSDRALWHKCWNDKGGWYPSKTSWAPLGGQILGGPAVATWGPGNLHVVVRGTDNALHYKGYNEQSGWTNWGTLDGATLSAPSIVSWGSGRLDIFVRGLDNACHHRVYDKNRNGWGPWENLGGNITGVPAAVAWGPNRLDIVVRGSDGAAWTKSWTPAGYYPSKTEWTSLGGNITDTPSIASWGHGRLDFVARGSDGAVWHKSYTEGAGWYPPSLTEWTSLGGSITGSPMAIPRGKDRLDIVVRGTDGAVWYKYYQLPSTLVGHLGAGASAAKQAEYAKRWHPALTVWERLGSKQIK